jgi:voltage-gated potassium channel
MKFLTPLLSMLAGVGGSSRGRAMLRLVGAFVLAVVVFSVGFHALMALEGREFSWWSSVYWTVVTMSTLGFGDIVFDSDIGRMYSLVVLLTGSVLILMLLPFTFIQFVYVPWQQAQRRARAPRELPPETTGHLILTGLEPMEEALLHRADAAGVPTVLLVADVDEAIGLHDRGYDVMYGALDDPETYRAARASQAAMLVTARSDTVNTNLVFTLREVTDAGIVVATASSRDSIDVLQLAGADHVIHLGNLLGQSLARRILAPSARSRVLSTFEDLQIAEAAAHGTALVGSSLAELDLRERVGVSVVAIWNRGRLHMARPGLRIEETSVLVLVGRSEQLEAFDALFDDERDADPDEEPDGHVVILGGGRVGRAAARELREADISTTIVERLPERIRPDISYVEGDAADIDVLREAGIDRATAVVITTHEDDVNIYLTIYCRRLRPDVEILGRVNVDRNLSTMHRAGADFVLSYASTGATEAWNLLRNDSTVLLTEGLLVFQVPVPAEVAGRRLADLDIPEETGCSVIGFVQSEGRTTTRVVPDEPLPGEGRLLLIGDEEAEERFYARYVADGRGSWLRRLGLR